MMKRSISNHSGRIAPPYRQSCSRLATRFVSTSKPLQPISRNVALAVGTISVAAVSYAFGQSSIAHAHSDHTQGPLQAAVANGEQQTYASPEVVQEVIRQLKGSLKPNQVKLKEDQVSVDKDDRLQHGSSPNTYHGKHTSHTTISFRPALP